MTVASLSVPLVGAEDGVRRPHQSARHQHRENDQVGHASLQPKFDLFNVLNVSPVYAVRTLNYGTASYLQPSSILVGRVFQLGAVIKF